MENISYFSLQLSLNRAIFAKTQKKSVLSACPTKQVNVTQTDTNLSDLFAQRTKLARKLITESLGACE